MNMVCTPKHYYNQTPLYEMNYSKLLRLFRTVPGVCHRIHHPTGLSFAVALQEDHRYTSVVEIVVALANRSTLALNLTMTVRMYHDAKVAEVMNCAGHGTFEPEYSYPNKNMLQRDEKRQVNQLLGEWLDFFARRSETTLAEPQDAA